ncbi:MAG: hypothetical protein AAGA87_14405 [Pseudomonadota bacterium]
MHQSALPTLLLAEKYFPRRVAEKQRESDPCNPTGWRRNASASRLCRFPGARLLLDKATGLDQEAKHITLHLGIPHRRAHFKRDTNFTGYWITS